MFKKENMSVVGWFLIVIVVAAGAVYLAFNKKVEVGENLQAGRVEQNKIDIKDTTKNMDNTQQQEGVKITVLKEGTGVLAKNGDTVAMNYTGTLENGTTFDSNVDPKFGHVEPFVFTLGVGQVIKGWDVGVAGMKVGEKRKLEINPEYGYGASGAGASIPPNAKLIFEVELLQIK